jgi:hypothetical protein
MVEIMSGVIAGAIAFMIIKAFVTAMGTSGWSDLEITLWTVIIPMVLSVIIVLYMLKKISV